MGGLNRLQFGPCCPQHRPDKADEQHRGGAGFLSVQGYIEWGAGHKFHQIATGQVRGDHGLWVHAQPLLGSAAVTKARVDGRLCRGSATCRRHRGVPSALAVLSPAVSPGQRAGRGVARFLWPRRVCHAPPGCSPLVHSGL